MGILSKFEARKERLLEERRLQQIDNCLKTVENICNTEEIAETERIAGYKYIAEEILGLLPEDVLVFELSADIYAIKPIEKKQIEDYEIRNLEWVREYCQDRSEETYYDRN